MTPDLVTHLDPRNVGMTIQLGKQAADEINRLHRDRVATMVAEIEAMREAIMETASHLSGFLGFHSDALSLDQVWALSATLDKLKPFIKP